MFAARVHNIGHVPCIECWVVSTTTRVEVPVAVDARVVPIVKIEAVAAVSTVGATCVGGNSGSSTGSSSSRGEVAPAVTTIIATVAASVVATPSADVRARAWLRRRSPELSERVSGQGRALQVNSQARPCPQAISLSSLLQVPLLWDSIQSS